MFAHSPLANRSVEITAKSRSDERSPLAANRRERSLT